MKQIPILKGRFAIDVDWLLSMCRSSPSDLVLVSGTLIEGIGNAGSDLDVYVIADNLPRRGRFANSSFYTEILDGDGHLILENDEDGQVHALYFYHPTIGIHVDVKFLTQEKLDAIFSEIRSASDSLLNDDNIFYTTAPLSFGYDDSQIIHRILHSVCVSGSSEFASLKDSIPLMEYHCAVYGDLALDHPALLDLKGFLSASESILALEVARSLLFRNTHALLVALGATNRNPKWISKYLHLLPESLAERFIDVLTADSRTEENRLSYIRNAVQYIEESHFITLATESSARVFGELQRLAPFLKSGLSRRQAQHQMSIDAYNIRAWSFGFGSQSAISEFIGRQS